MSARKPNRCSWCGDDPLYVKYHDEEWGRLTVNKDGVCPSARRLFECWVLETAQAGLSWITVLRKREAYRKAFYGFNAARVAKMTPADVDRLMQNQGIIRNRRKIEATISNARCFLAVVKEFGTFDAYVRSFLLDGKPIDNHPKTLRDIPASSPVSDALSRDLRRRGFKFAGTTICYAFLQAAGYVNDHLRGCAFRF